MFGLEEKEIGLLQSLFIHFPEIEKVILYGSRAKGNYKPFSDVDISLVGESITHNLRNHIDNAIEELSLPYFFDINIYHKLHNPNLIDHINRRGVVLYEADREH